ncbi:Copper amine oxidase [Metarhizium brunneum]
MMSTFFSSVLALIHWLSPAANPSSSSCEKWGASPTPVHMHHLCESRQPAVSAPHPNIWGDLTDEEAAGVIELLHRQSTGLNLTTEDAAGSWDNKILLVELLAPNKSDTLPFLNNKTTTPPPRCARATLMFGATLNPFLQDYVIGPLPVSNNTQVQPLQFLYNNAGKGKVAVDFADRSAVHRYVKDVGMSVADITKRLWDGTLNDTLALLPIFPPWKENSSLVLWSGFVNTPTSTFDSKMILPLGLYFGVDVMGRDPSKWSVIGWYYDGIYYPTTNAFRAAAALSNFTLLGTNSDGPWAQIERQGSPMKFDHLPPPTAVMPGSNRFSVDAKENYVEWMDFSFFLSYYKDNGLRLFNVQYKGRRILYELGLQEALTLYAGNDPVLSGTTYFDSKPGIGPSVVSLVDGYDCPTYSTYLNATYRQGEKSYTRFNAICLFEFDQGYPIQRHSTANYTSVTKNIAFTVRSISAIGNYDYMFSYNFFLDGSIEVSVRASGYIHGGFSANNEEYGWKIHDNLSGSMHDHVLTYKADIDVLGEKNSLQKVEFVPATIEYPWSNGAKRNTMKLQKSFVQNENEAKINWAPNGAAMYAIVNKEAKNKFGEYPGYRFTPATSNVIFLTASNSSNVMNAVNFADHHFYVTKQKDTEAQGTHPYNVLNPADPLIDFAKFFDGESLDQEDLVLWFNLGMHHAPHTGDLPNTVSTTAHSALIIKPLNYLEMDASRATSQQVRLNYKDGKVQSIKTFGSQNMTCHVDASQLMPKLWRDKGTVSVLTFVPGQSLIHPILEPPRQVTTMRTRKIPRVSSEYKVANVT